jgi:hypothetical protein
MGFKKCFPQQLSPHTQPFFSNILQLITHSAILIILETVWNDWHCMGFYRSPYLNPVLSRSSRLYIHPPHPKKSYSRPPGLCFNRILKIRRSFWHFFEYRTSTNFEKSIIFRRAVYWHGCSTPAVSSASFSSKLTVICKQSTTQLPRAREI